MLYFKIIIVLVYGTYVGVTTTSQDFHGTASQCRAEASRIEQRLTSKGVPRVHAVCTGTEKASSDALYEP